MHIKKYLTEEGLYVVDGVAYGDKDDPLGFILSYFFEFCTCGRPEENGRLIRDVLDHVANLQELVWEDKITFEEWDRRGNEIAPLNCLYFIYHVLDSMGLLEHGSSVPGWLTSSGFAVLSDLNEILGETDENL